MPFYLKAGLVFLLMCTLSYAGEARAADNILIGNSLFARWPDNPIGSVNLAISGARIEDAQAELSKAKTQNVGKAFVLVGTNNLPTDKPYDIFQGILGVVKSIYLKYPASKVFVVSLLPRGPGLRYKSAEIAETNKALSTGAVAGNYKFINVHDALVQKCQGAETCSMFLDGLHLSPDGYALLGEVITQSIN